MESQWHSRLAQYWLMINCMAQIKMGSTTKLNTLVCCEDCIDSPQINQMKPQSIKLENSSPKAWEYTL